MQRGPDSETYWADLRFSLTASSLEAFKSLPREKMAVGVARRLDFIQPQLERISQQLTYMKRELPTAKVSGQVTAVEGDPPAEVRPG
jgi:hypothetical protein